MPGALRTKGFVAVMKNRQRRPLLRWGTAERVAIFYIIGASLWIVASDWLSTLPLASRAVMANIQTYKGLAFVVFSGVLIYALLRMNSRGQRQAEIQLRQLSAAVEQSASAVIITDSDGIIEYVNPRFSRLTGYAMEEVIGQNPRLLQSGTKSREEYVELWQTIKSGREWRGEFYNKRKDGGFYWASATISPIRDERGAITHFIAVQEDITPQKRTTEKLEQHIRELSLRNRIVSAAASTLRIDEVLSVTCRELAQAFDAPQVTVALLDETRETLEIVAEHGTIQPEANPSLGERVPVSEVAVLYDLIKHNEARAIENVEQQIYPASARAIMTQRGITSLLLIPLLVRGELTGVIELASPEKGRFTDEAAALATNVSATVSQSLDNARLYGKVSRYNDQLVQMVNQRTEELQRARDRVSAILDNTPDPILLLQPDGRIETANLSFYELFGFEEDVYRYPISRLVEPENRPALLVGLRQANEAGQVARIEVTVRGRSGQKLDAELALAAFEESGSRRLVCVLRDISALKAVERMKDAFVSNVSHELRTPITSLRLYHHLMELNPDKTGTYMGHLGREINRLSTIIEDLLTLSRLDQGRFDMTFAPVDLDALVGQYALDREVMAQDCGLHIVYRPQPELPLVEADHGMIGQVLSVLLTNAINYTPRGGLIEVCTRKRQEGDRLWAGFSVSDTGHGISPEEQAEVFERFFRGKMATETNAPGTGLGLAIAREIVEQHRGRIELRSSGQPGDGAEFSVWLPAIED
ncbi:MAG TPA: PAS domain S-box protein [Aggregatilineales bacterium]|nr:PAS domain S-box protein [Aggregatilineales bacterium]